MTLPILLTGIGLMALAWTAADRLAQRLRPSGGGDCFDHGFDIDPDA